MKLFQWIFVVATVFVLAVCAHFVIPDDIEDRLVKWCIKVESGQR